MYLFGSYILTQIFNLISGLVPFVTLVLSIITLLLVVQMKRSADVQENNKMRENFCSNCNKTVESTDGYCPICGKKLR